MHVNRAHFISMGIAVGVFVGCTPTIPFHTLLAVILAFFLQGSKTAAVLGVWVCNPLTLPFLYLGSFKIGKRLIAPDICMHNWLEWLPDLLKTGIDAMLVMIAGGIVIGTVFGICAYFLARCSWWLWERKGRRSGVVHLPD